MDNCLSMLKTYESYVSTINSFNYEKKNKGAYHYYQFKIPILVSILNDDIEMLKLEIKDFSRDERNVCQILSILKEIIIKDNKLILDPPEREFYNLIYNTVDFPFMYKIKFSDKNLANNVIHIQIVK